MRANGTSEKPEAGEIGARLERLEHPIDGRKRSKGGWITVPAEKGDFVLIPDTAEIIWAHLKGHFDHEWVAEWICFSKEHWSEAQVLQFLGTSGISTVAENSRVMVGDAKPAAGGRNLKDSARDLMAAFGRYKGRALFITGTQDPEGMGGHELFKGFCRKRRIASEFHLIAGATHSYYSSAHKEEALRLTMEWLRKGG